jgi:glucosamine--fructose-6-phosphate aminotransferase (isomerizing)
LSGDAEALARLHRLPDLLENLISRLGKLSRKLGESKDIQRFFFLGAGPFYGLANEAMLKMKEMTLSYSEAYHPMEFRHGPMSMVDEHALVVGFLSDTSLAQEIHVLKDMHALGAQTLAIVEDASVFDRWRPDHVIELRSGLDEWSRGALYLPPLQRMAYHRAVAKGLNPDRPTHLTAVIEL